MSVVSRNFQHPVPRIPARGKMAEEACEATQVQAQIHCQIMDHWGARERERESLRQEIEKIYYASKKLLER